MRRAWWLFFASYVIALAAPAAAADAGVIVLPATARVADRGLLVDGILPGAAGTALSMRVVTAEELATLLSASRLRSFKACTSAPCWAKFRDDLPVAYLLATKVMVWKGKLTLTVQVVDLAQKKQLASIKRAFADDEAVYAGEIAALLADVRAKLPEQAPPPVAAATSAPAAPLPPPELPPPPPSPTPQPEATPAPAAPAPPPRPSLGLKLRSVTPEMAASAGLPFQAGVEVVDVAAEGIGKDGGLEKGDILLTFDGKPTNETDLERAVAEADLTRWLPLDVWRARSRITRHVFLGDKATAPAKPIVIDRPPEAAPAAAAAAPAEPEPPKSPYQIVVLKNRKSVRGTILDYDQLSIRVKLAPGEKKSGLRFELSLSGEFESATAEDEVSIPLGHVLAIDWGTESNPHRAQVEAVLAGLATRESAFFDLDFNITGATWQKTPDDPTTGAEGISSYSASLGPEAVARLEEERFGLYGDGRVEFTYDDPGGGADPTNRLVVGGAGSSFLGDSSLLAQTGASSDFLKTGAKVYVFEDFFFYGEHEINFVRQDVTVTDPATLQTSSESTSIWHNRGTGGAGLGRLINITGVERMKMADRYLSETGLTSGPLPESVRARLSAVYAQRSLPNELVRETFRILAETTPNPLTRPAKPEEVIGLLEVLQDAFIEREQGLEIKTGFGSDIHRPNEGEDRQSGGAVALVLEEPLSEQVQLGWRLQYSVVEVKLAEDFTLLNSLNLTFRASQALTLTASDNFFLVKAPLDPSLTGGESVDTTLILNQVQLAVVYNIIDRVDIRADFKILSQKLKVADVETDLLHTMQANLSLSYDLY